MTNLRTSGDANPAAYVSKNKQRVKQYDGTVYLKNKQGQNVKLKIDEEDSSSILFPENSENVKWPKLIFNPIW